MEKGKRTRQEFRPLLLKLAIPLALPLVGLIFSIITGNTRTRRERNPSYLSSQEESSMGSSESSSLCEFEDEDCSIYQEEDDDDDDQAEDEGGGVGPLEFSRMQTSEIPTEVSIVDLQKAHSSEEEMEDLKSAVAAIDDRAREIELRFQDYCNAQEKESMDQKLQIMYLGLNLDRLEATKQRFEDSISNQHPGVEKHKKMTSELRFLMRRVKKLGELGNTHLLEARRQALILKAREAEMVRIKEELKEVKEQLLEAKKLSDEKLEPPPAKHQSASENKEEIKVDSSKMLEQFRWQWYLEMEELVYLSWVGASLRHQVLSTNQKREDDDEEVKAMKEIEEQLMEVPAKEEFSSCKVEFYGAELGDDQACFDATPGRSRPVLMKPRLLHKLRGWAKGKRSLKKLGKRDGRWCG